MCVPVHDKNDVNTLKKVNILKKQELFIVKGKRWKTKLAKVKSVVFMCCQRPSKKFDVFLQGC